MHHLDLEVSVNRESIPHVAAFLFGRAAFDKDNKPHGLVYEWVLEVLKMRLSWKQCLHDMAVETGEGIRRDVYIACKGKILAALTEYANVLLITLPDVTVRTCGPQEIIAYLGALTSLVNQLDLTRDSDRQRQHNYYRDHLYVVEVLMGGMNASSPRE